MGYIETLCTKCNKPIWVPENKINENKIHECGGELIPIELPHDDYILLTYIWNDRNSNKNDIRVNWDLYNAMVELKKNDIIEYNLKMAQFRTQVNQQKQQQESNVPKCPHCRSTNIKSISAINRGASIAMLGAFSKKINKSFECKNCGYTW